MHTIMSDLPQVIIDTNVVLDLWLFADPRFAALKTALETQTLKWLATPAMRHELERVLTSPAYPQIAKALIQRGQSAAAVLQAFDRHSHAKPPAARAPIRCKDEDDQIFIDLAVAHGAVIYSKDRAVRVMAKRLAKFGAGLAVF